MDSNAGPTTIAQMEFAAGSICAGAIAADNENKNTNVEGPKVAPNLRTSSSRLDHP